MAGDWIKVENSTPNKPEILRIARMLGITKDDAFGKSMRFWIWLDANCVDGVVDGVVSTDVDAIVECDGFSDALTKVRWLSINENDETLVITNFKNHNGETAKKRASKNKRQANWRNKVDGDVDKDASTDATTREEKRRDKEIYKEKFNQFWLIWPKKVCKDTAKKSYIKIKPDDLLQAKIIKAVKSQALMWSDPQYIPNPSTWLNQKRWEDEISPNKVSYSQDHLAEKIQ